ncbi:hypothetical protein RR46_03256 [Papilio xuthus]|uniref:Uncharacterized protein n=1 Tax=Papilio xuthus TaxID=66420 RepID=A0A194QI91_PAPXU|nr:hypothetical protein RR46_03256 [Papilio xuthus]
MWQVAKGRCHTRRGVDHVVNCPEVRQSQHNYVTLNTKTKVCKRYKNSCAFIVHVQGPGGVREDRYLGN